MPEFLTNNITTGNNSLLPFIRVIALTFTPKSVNELVDTLPCKERGHTIKKKRMEKNNKYLKKCEDQGACFSPLPFESFGFAGKEVLDLVSSLVKKASESLNIDFASLLSYWKKRMSTTLQVYTAKFILETSVSKRNPQRRQDIVDSALLETYHVRAAQ